MEKHLKKGILVTGIVLTLVLVLSGVVQAAANPVRDMPESVKPGEDFNVTVNWAAPADGFNAIGLTDNANATANMTVSGNTGWCTPNANSVNPVNNTIEYMWFGPYNNGTEFTAVYSVHVPTGTPEGNYTFDGNLLYYIGGNGPYTEGIAGDSVITIEKKPKAIFDTGSPENPYPSIFGIHNVTIKPNVTIEVCWLYTYPCAGTGGHTEYARIWKKSGLDVNVSWNRYVDDWHNISFSETFTLFANETYNYTIRTGSYPQIHHTGALLTASGWINCTEFTDANGKEYKDGIPAIKFW